MRKAEWPEGPHLYKKDGYYYILHAEGGTGPAHAVCVARSKELWGPYENNLMNPVFTHRHLGKDYPIRYVGHADLIEDTNGNWYAVMLASRPCEWHTNMGRETFLAKVTWEDGWPVFNAGIGILEDAVTVPFPETEGELVTSGEDAKGIPFSMVQLRNPVEDAVVRDSEGYRLKLLPYTLPECEPVAYLGLRQTSYYYTAKTTLALVPEQDGEAAGLVVFQSEAAFLAIVYGKFDGKNQVRVVKNSVQGGIELVAAEELTAEKCTFKVSQKGQLATLSYDAGEGENVLAADVSTKILSTESAGGFVGCTIGMFATANGKESSNTALFSGIEYTAE